MRSPTTSFRTCRRRCDGPIARRSLLGGALAAATLALTDQLLALDAWKTLPAVVAGNVFPITWIDLCTYRWAEQALADFDDFLDRLRPVG